MAEDEARVPIRDRGYLHGDGAFETVCIHGGAPFRREAHFARLRGSLEILRIEPAWSPDELLRGMRAVAEANQVTEGLLRITITAGERPTSRGSATIASRALPDVPPDPALHLSTVARRLAGPLSQCKSIARAAESLALREAEAEGAFDAILQNEKGRIVETTARNLFLVADGGLWTPPTTDGALAGITRGTVLEIASREGIPVRERSVSLERLRSAQALFLTGSGVGVLGIASVDGHRFPFGEPITERIRAAYRTALDLESRW